MNRILSRLASRFTGSFVAHGVRIDEDGKLCFPDGLDPERVQRFIELVIGRHYDCPRDAIHDLFLRVGVSPKAVDVLGHVIRERGDVDLAAAAHHWRPLTAALPALHQIPVRFRDFLVEDLGLGDPSSGSLEAAIESARCNAAARIGCEPTWDAILARPDGVSELAAAWRARGVQETPAEPASEQRARRWAPTG